MNLIFKEIWVIKLGLLLQKLILFHFKTPNNLKVHFACLSLFKIGTFVVIKSYRPIFLNLIFSSLSGEKAKEINNPNVLYQIKRNKSKEELWKLIEENQMPEGEIPYRNIVLTVASNFQGTIKIFIY